MLFSRLNDKRILNFNHFFTVQATLTTPYKIRAFLHQKYLSGFSEKLFA